MCECGCASGLPTYRLPIDEKEFYGIELYGGCKDCSTPPGIFIRRLTVGSDLAWLWQDAPRLQLASEKDEVTIKCGLTPDEFQAAIIKALVGVKVHGKGGTIDKHDAEEIVEDIWEPRSPEVVEHL